MKIDFTWTRLKTWVPQCFISKAKGALATIYMI